MSYQFLDIDHLLASGDPQLGDAQYTRLGFTVTPLSVIENLGVANRLILLRPLTPGTANFFECMGISDAERASKNPMGALLSGEPGVRSMVLSGPDALASFKALSRDGFPFSPPVDIEREWRLPDGEVLKPAFRVTLPIGPPLRFNFCEYRTLHYYLRENWLKHENGARHLTNVFAIAEAPLAVAHYYERVFGNKMRQRDGILTITPGKMGLKVGDAAALRNIIPARWLPARANSSRYLGFEVQVDSLAHVRRLLEERQIEFADQADSLVVAPHEACGNVLRFVESVATH